MSVLSLLPVCDVSRGLELDNTGTVPSVTPEQTSMLERISLDYPVVLVSEDVADYGNVHVLVGPAGKACADLEIWPDGLVSITVNGCRRSRLAYLSLSFELDNLPADTKTAAATLLEEFGSDVEATATRGVYVYRDSYVLTIKANQQVRISKPGASSEGVTVSADDAVKLIRMFCSVTNPLSN